MKRGEKEAHLGAGRLLEKKGRPEFPGVALDARSSQMGDFSQFLEVA